MERSTKPHPQLAEQRGATLKRLLRILVLLVVRLIGMPGAYTASRQTRSPRPGTSRILLIRPDHLGDLLLTTPVLHALKTRAPDVRITMMAGPWSV